jgi:chromosome segregation ATPase
MGGIINTHATKHLKAIESVDGSVKSLDKQLEVKDAEIKELKRQLEAKDMQHKEQLEAKDAEIKELKKQLEAKDIQHKKLEEAKKFQIQTQITTINALNDENTTLKDQHEADVSWINKLEERKKKDDALKKDASDWITKLQGELKNEKDAHAKDNRENEGKLNKLRTPESKRCSAMEAKMTEVVDALNKFSACNNNLAISIKKIIAPQAKPVVASQAEPTASQPTAVVASQAAASQLTASQATTVVPATASQAIPPAPRPRPPDGRKQLKDMPRYSTTFTPVKP